MHLLLTSSPNANVAKTSSAHNILFPLMHVSPLINILHIISECVFAGAFLLLLFRRLVRIGFIPTRRPHHPILPKTMSPRARAHLPKNLAFISAPNFTAHRNAHPAS